MGWEGERGKNPDGCFPNSIRAGVCILASRVLWKSSKRKDQKRGEDGGDQSVLRLADVVHAIATTGWRQTVTIPSSVCYVKCVYCVVLFVRVP